MEITLSYSKPTRQLVDVNLKFTVNHTEYLQLPSWRPGRYELMNYAQYLYPLKISAGEAEIEKVTKDRWKIVGSGEIVITYQFYAARMDAGSSWLDENQLYLNFVNFIPWLEEKQHLPIELTIILPSDYKTACSLKKTGNHTFFASNYYELSDSPLIASASIRTLQYRVAQTNFFIHIQGDWEADNQVISDFQKFTQTQVDFFGGSFPNDEFHFLIQALPYKNYHGVEHRNSTVIAIGPANEMTNRSLYKEVLGICSHELFHCWNVTRIRPKEMVPYDLTKEAYHTTGFITEGLTTYYGDWALWKSGVFSDQEYWNEVNTMLKRHYQNEGRKTATLTESSMDLWLDGYKLGSPNRKVSIYNEGALCALLLDLKLQNETDGKISLQNILRDLWKKFGDTRKGYTLADYKQLVNQYIDATSYFEKYIEGNWPIEVELSMLLSTIGKRLIWTESDNPLERNFGIRTVPKGEYQEIIRLAENSEAESVFMIGDIILEQHGNHFKINRREMELKHEILPSGNYFGYYQIQ